MKIALHSKTFSLIVSIIEAVLSKTGSVLFQWTQERGLYIQIKDMVMIIEMVIPVSEKTGNGSYGVRVGSLMALKKTLAADTITLEVKDNIMTASWNTTCFELSEVHIEEDLLECALDKSKGVMLTLDGKTFKSIIETALHSMVADASNTITFDVGVHDPEKTPYCNLMIKTENSYHKFNEKLEHIPLLSFEKNYEFSVSYSLARMHVLPTICSIPGTASVDLCISTEQPFGATWEFNLEEGGKPAIIRYFLAPKIADT